MAIKKYHVSKNLFDELYPDVTTTLVYKAINVGNGSFTLSTNAPLVNDGALLFMLAGDVTTGASTSNNGVSESVSRTVTAVNGYITIAYLIRGGKSPADYEVMLNTGSTALPYEPYGNTWTEIPYRKYDTETDTLTTLPAEIIADGNNATVGLVGDMVQTGTPTPQNPIEPEEVGVLVTSGYQAVEYLQNSGTQYIDTGLKGSDLADCELEIVMRNDAASLTSYNFNGTYLSGSTAQFGLVATSNTECRSSMNFGFADAISITGLSLSEFHTIYATNGSQKVDNIVVGTLNFGTLNNGSFLLFARTDPNQTSGMNICVAMSLKSFTVKRNNQYIRNMIPVRRKSDNELGLYDTANDVFYTNQGTGSFIAGSDVNKGQYKIPILSGGTTTPVYLGEVQSTRRIKKLVLTGGENVELQSTNVHGIANFWFYNLLSGIEQNNQLVAISSHFVQTYTPIADVTSPCFSVSTSSQSLYLKVNASDIPTVNDMKTYLQQQYANGTPVTVWYVLDTPETGILNEPIRKIGDYADTVSGITIPTLGTAEQFDVDTTLKPSSVELTYHGWHRHEAKEYSNGQWITPT